MVVSGRFSKVSDTTYKDGVVLVGLTGSLYPHDLTKENIQYIKDFYCMHDSKHEFCDEWPENVKPAYPAAEKNFKNGFLLLRGNKI